MYDFFMILLTNLWDLPSAIFVGIALLALAYTIFFQKAWIDPYLRPGVSGRCDRFANRV